VYNNRIKPQILKSLKNLGIILQDGHLDSYYLNYRQTSTDTRLDKIRSEVIRKELEISGTQDVRLKYKQNWINHFERTDNTRLPKDALNDIPRGRRGCGRPRKRW
jgi:hypothetical protein